MTRPKANQERKAWCRGCMYECCESKSEYIHYGTGCPVKDKEDRDIHFNQCFRRFSHCFDCESRCEFIGAHILDEGECPLRYDP